MKSMFNNNLINVPGMNPQKKNKFQDDTPVNTQSNEFDWIKGLELEINIKDI